MCECVACVLVCGSMVCVLGVFFSISFDSPKLILQRKLVHLSAELFTL